MLKSALLESAGFAHAFGTRADSLDDVARFLGTDAAHVRRAKQVHSARVIELRGEPTEAIEADALVSRRGDAVAVQTADCVPILLADRASGAVAAVHAGWRGVAGNIVPNAVESLRARPSDLAAAIGPCIMACSFEVGDDVAKKIADASDASVIAKRHAPGKAMVDLRRAARIQLERLGLAAAAIDDIAECTYCDRERFFSYRRDGANAGRLISAVAPRQVPR